MQPIGTAWVPIAEAARQLGVSVDTVRRRIKRGDITAERRETPQGFVWWVCLGGLAEVGSTAAYADAEVGSDSPMQDAEVGSDGPPRRQQSEAPHLAALVRELQAEVVLRTEAATTWQVRADILAHQLAAAENKIKMLEAPKEEPAAVSTSVEPSPSGLTHARRLVPIARALAALALVLLAAAAWVR